MHEPFLEQTAGMNVVSCSANMVLVIHFWIPKKKMRKYKIYIYIYIYISKKKYSEEIQKIIGAKKGCWNADQNWLRRFKNAKG
jgi:hypothetical protein